MEKNKKEFELLYEKEIIIEKKNLKNIRELHQNNQSFLLIHTQISKGLAALMLLYHHLLRPGNKLNSSIKNEMIIFGIDLRRYISVFFKITTCSYTFLSGIGIYYSLIKFKSIKDMYKKCLKNFFRLMIVFWIILIIVFPKGLQTGLFKLDFTTIIYCIFADYYRKGNWWYVRMHFALLIYSPLFIKLFQDSDYKRKIFSFMVFYFFYFSIKIIQISFEFKGMINIFFHYFSYFSNIEIILSFLSGIISAKYNLMEIFNNNKIESIYYSLFSIFSAVFIRCNLIYNEASTKIDFFIVPLFIMPIASLVSKNKILSGILSLFGKHSTNFWFLHGYFYDNFYLSILTLPKYSNLCYIWLVIMTLISSYIINLILVPILNYINLRNFNYKGYFHFIYKNK